MLSEPWLKRVGLDNSTEKYAQKLLLGLWPPSLELCWVGWYGLTQHWPAQEQEANVSREKYFQQLLCAAGHDVCVNRHVTEQRLDAVFSRVHGTGLSRYRTRICSAGLNLFKDYSHFLVLFLASLPWQLSAMSSFLPRVGLSSSLIVYVRRAAWPLFFIWCFRIGVFGSGLHPLLRCPSKA